MKLAMLRLAVAILAFTFGVAGHRILISRGPAEAPRPETTPACDPGRIEVRTVFVPPSAPPPLAVFDFDPDKFNPTGTYQMIGQEPKGLEGFRYLELWWREKEDGTLSGTAMAGIYVDGIYKAPTPIVSLVTRRRVVLIVEGDSKDAAGYRFDGQFLYNNIDALADKQKPVLRGTLTRTRNGKKVAEAIVSFSLERHVGC